MNNTLKPIIYAIAVIITALIITSAFKKAVGRTDKISVTGLAKKDFTADLIVWQGSFTRKSLNMKEAYADLKKDADAIKAYLLKKGVAEKEIVFSAVALEKMYEERGGENNRVTVFTGYSLVQSISIESKEVDKIQEVSREVTELIDAGIEFTSSAPEYYYTKLAELKIEMLAAATRDAHTRAQKIAENAGSDVGDLQTADMGVFQITAQNSAEEYTWGGTFNTSAKRKTAAITVDLVFEVD